MENRESRWVRACRWATTVTRINNQASVNFTDAFSMHLEGYAADYQPYLDELAENRSITTTRGVIHEFPGDLRTLNGMKWAYKALRKAQRYLGNVALQNYGVWEIMDAKIHHVNPITERNLRDCIEMVCLRAVDEFTTTVVMSQRSWQQAVEAKTGRKPGPNTLAMVIRYMNASGYFVVTTSPQGDRDDCTTITILPDDVPLIDVAAMNSWYSSLGPIMELVRDGEADRRAKRQENAPRVAEEIKIKNNRKATEIIEQHGYVDENGRSRVHLGRAA